MSNNPNVILTAGLDHTEPTAVVIIMRMHHQHSPHHLITSNLPRRTTHHTVLSDNYELQKWIVIFCSPQVAVIAGNLELAEVIQTHKQEDVGKN